MSLSPLTPFSQPYSTVFHRWSTKRPRDRSNSINSIDDDILPRRHTGLANATMARHNVISYPLMQCESIIVHLSLCIYTCSPLPVNSPVHSSSVTKLPPSPRYQRFGVLYTAKVRRQQHIPVARPRVFLPNKPRTKPMKLYEAPTAHSAQYRQLAP